MPTNQTPNYSLSQWERSDKILMDDFNADNAKIDAALKAQTDALAAEAAARANALSDLEKRSTTQIIKTVSIGSAASEYTLSLSGISWADWREVVVSAQISGVVYKAYPVGTTETSYINSSNSFMTLVFYPMLSSSSPAAGLALSAVSPKVFGLRDPFYRLTSLRFQTDSSADKLPASSKFIVYGVK